MFTDHVDPEYPRAESWAKRFEEVWSKPYMSRVFELVSDDNMTWNEIRELKYTYGFYFNDMVELVRRVGEDQIVWGFDEEVPPNDEYFGMNVPTWKEYWYRLADAGFELENFNFIPKHQPYKFFFMDTDFIVFTAFPLVKNDELEIKLTTDLNMVDLTNQINLFDFTYTD